MGAWEGETDGAVDIHRLVHVHDHKVVVAGLGPGELGAVQLGRLADDAQEGVNVGLLVRGRDVAPGDVC